MTHIMLKTHTLLNRPGAVVLSVALVRFSDEVSTTLNLSVPDQTALGLEIDPETHAWWGGQPPESWTAATANPTPLAAALAYITSWIAWASPEADPLIWCHGATFDAPILGEVYRRAGLTPPWQHWNIQCTRTLFNLAGVDVRQYQVPPPHVALNDALGQTRAANAALGILARVRGVAA